MPEINDVIDARKRVYLFLYGKRVQTPATYYDRNDLKHLAEPELLEAAIRFGQEKKYLIVKSKSFQLTAEGMEYVEMYYTD
jgi:hypothetical protein